MTGRALLHRQSHAPRSSSTASLLSFKNRRFCRPSRDDPQLELPKQIHKHCTSAILTSIS